MRIDEFWSRLEHNNYKIYDSVLEEISGYLKKISRADRRRLADGVIETVTYSEIKTAAVIYKIAASLSLRRQVKEKAYFFCSSCGERFSIESRGCPKCGQPLYQLKYKTGLLEQEEFAEITPVHEDCWACIHYEPQAEPEAGPCKGPTCGGYGKGHIGGEQCTQCKCVHCCREKYIQNNNWEQFHELDINGKLEDRIREDKKGA